MSLNLNELNPEQREAVTTTEGALLVLAGAGSGKTGVITSRIAYLIGPCQVPPSAVLAVTFTNKAAREMSERVAKLTRTPGRKQRKGGGSARDDGPLLCTFHAFGMRLLHAHITLLGYRASFTIMDSPDQASVVKSLLEEGDYDLGGVKPKDVYFALQNAKSRGITAEELQTHRDLPADVQLGRLLADYDKTLQRLNAIDFEDILILSLRLCHEHPVAAQEFFRRFRYVMVDEYQDTNRRQYEMLQAVAAGHGNLCAVGDDDQSIYGWRGAEPGNILDFERDFPQARVIRLESNYRSSGTILQAANQVIRQNPNRREKTLRPTRGPGDPLEWMVGEDETDEIEKVVTHLRLAHLRDGLSYGDIAVLYRSNHQSRRVEESLREEGIPYRLVGGTRFFERREVKDALAYLRLIHEPLDEVSLLRVINFPRRGIGRASQTRLVERAAAEGRPALALMREAAHLDEFSGAPATAMERFAVLIGDYRHRFESEPLGATFRDLMRHLDFHGAVEKERSDPKGAERSVGLILELELAIDRYAQNRPEAKLKDFLEYVVLMTLPEENDAADRTPMVSLLTVHSAKGLEFERIYLIHMAEDLFPNKRALAEGGDDEERRLCYVAITRAKRNLILSMSRIRKRWGEVIRQQPSRFLLDIEAGLFDGPAPSSGGEETQELRVHKAAAARSRFFDQVRGRKADAQAGD